jgi:hypothetical protein
LRKTKIRNTKFEAPNKFKWKMKAKIQNRRLQAVALSAAKGLLVAANQQTRQQARFCHSNFRI